MSLHVTAGHMATRLGDWQSTGPSSGYAALADRIRLLVLDGRLPTGMRVPSERQLADVLHVSRGTVATAYEQLRERGFLLTRRGAGSWTSLPDAPAATGPTTPFAPHFAHASIDMAHAAPAAPPDVIHAAATRAANELPRYLGDHGYDLLGLPSLRAAVAERLSTRGLPTEPEQVMITGGAQHALMLVLRAMVRSGDRVLLDHPTYPNALEAIRGAAARPVPVPLAEYGWDVDLVGSTLRDAAPRLAYLLPDFHNPTGRLMPEQQRAEIVEVARRSGTPLVVDETVAEMSLDGDSRRPMSACGGATNNRDVPVLTIGSASKVLWGGLRIGWLRGPRGLVRRIAASRAAVDMSSPVLEQLVVADLLTRVEEFLPQRLDTLRQNRDHLLAQLAERVPEWRTERPPGGLNLWVELGTPCSSALVTAAARRDLQLAAGPKFGTGGAFESFLRLPFVLPPEKLDEAVERLADSWRSLGHGATRELLTPPVI